MKLYVYSTLAADVCYQNTTPGGADLPVVTGQVLIKGGAGVANDRFVTPRGVATEITEQEAEILRANPVFQLHEKNGFVQISEKETSGDNAAADMTGRDNSAPIVSADLPDDSQPVDSDGDEEPKPRGKRR